MKRLLIAALLVASCKSARVEAVEAAAPQPPTPQHEWLQQLVGEWNVSARATMTPGEPPMQFEFTESVRSIGVTWVLAEGSAEFQGAPFTSLMTLGYDPSKQLFVGTWVDSMQTHLWTYRGALDSSGKVLTLETEGPSFGDPTQMAKYRDSLQVLSPDHRRLSSSVLGPDGAWTVFNTVDYHRVQ